MVSLRKKYRGGFTFIETIVGSAIFLVVALSTYRAFATLMEATSSARAKVAATELANERFEIIRNLPYSDVGILGGLPVGKIQRTQNVTKDNYIFTVTTSIRSVDDPFDGTIGGIPSDTSPADYKMADLDITCSNCKNFSILNFTTLIAPHALETGLGNGALYIRASDAAGIPIAGASIHIVNTQTNPDTIIDETTDNNGWLKIVDAPPGTSAYSITATKTNFSQEQTYPAGGAAGPTPLKPDANVVAQQVTQLSFSIDRLSSLNVTSVDQSCTVLPSIGFSLTGTKQIGTSVLKYPIHTFTTSSSGLYTVDNLEWDTYGALLTSPSYDLVGTSILPNFDINPNTSVDIKLIATPHLSTALLITVQDSSNNAINGATVRLQKTGFDQTRTTNSGTCTTPGQVFWNGLASGTYTLTISMAGFQTSTTSVNISGNWINQTITLTP